ncbi:MAG: hypothetical protein HFF54_08420 [Lawsonibacter sp.]|nr:hypothetical protein [Lawsonibacter sp.]
MEPVYEIDFSALDPEEKVEFMDDLRDSMAESFADQPAPVQILAQTLIFTRWWNSYQHMAPKEPAPEILGIAIELLWDFLEGKCGEAEFARFQKSFSDSALDILTGDDGELNEDPESDAFSRKYFTPWHALSYNVFLSYLCTVLEEAVSQDFTWDAVEGVIDGDIGDTMIDFFEPIYRNASGGYHPSELNRREKEAYSTPTFARVIALLQQDMRAALEGAPLAELRARYQNEYLFSPEESAKISDYR